MSLMPIFGQFTILSSTLVQFSGFSIFHFSHLIYENFNLCLQNTLNMLKTTRVYFGVLHQVINKIIKMTMLYYGGTSREKRNWVKGGKMLLFNAIFVDQYIEGHTIESRLTY